MVLPDVYAWDLPDVYACALWPLALILWHIYQANPWD